MIIEVILIVIIIKIINTNDSINSNIFSLLLYCSNKKQLCKFKIKE